MRRIFAIITLSIQLCACSEKKSPIVFQTDFGTKDGAVSAMKGVATQVDDDLQLFDLTHEIPAYDTWEAAYRLYQVAAYWPKGTVFVSVVDPGVGTERRSVVMHSKSGHYFVTPDNGTLTLVAESLGIEETREIDEAVNRRENSDSSYTFHGRDVYAYTAARLASGKISFEEVGKVLDKPIVRLEYQKPGYDAANNTVKGNIPVLDIQYGNAWTNIHDTIFRKLNISHGDTINIVISNKDSVVYKGAMPFVATFGDVPEGQPLAYLNSLMNLSFAINLGNFASAFSVKSGKDWNVEVLKNTDDTD